MKRRTIVVMPSTPTKKNKSLTKIELSASIMSYLNASTKTAADYIYQSVERGAKYVK